jgi:hypothetical protein
MGKMPDKFAPPGQLSDFNGQEHGRLRTLNKQIEQAEQWIYRRSSDILTAYSLAAAQTRHADSGRLDEDVNLTATLLFLVREDHPEFRPDGDNILARIDIPILPPASGDEQSTHPSPGSISGPNQRSGEWSSLLLNLYDLVLHRDMAKLLSIGALCINVALVQQQIRSW